MRDPEPTGRAGIAKRLRPGLELVRIHLAPTAVADSFAGLCMVAAIRGSPPLPSAAAAVTGASVLLYAMGMATNDLLDLPRDRRLYPGRPLPRGALSPTAGWVLAAALGIGGIGLAASISAVAGYLALMIALLALAYNSGAKWIPVLGCMVMGSCRSLNLILGAVAALGTSPPAEFFRDEIHKYTLVHVAAAILGLYIAGITAVSRLEDRPFRRGSFLVRTAPFFLVPACLVLLVGREAGPVTASLAILNGSLLAALLVSPLARVMATPISPVTEGDSPPSPPERSGGVGVIGVGAPLQLAVHPAKAFVRTGLLGVFLVDAGFLFAAAMPRQALVQHGLLILAWLWRRRWLQSCA